jgi:hypothetical protein
MLIAQQMKSIFHRIRVSTKIYHHRYLNICTGSSNDYNNKTFRILGVQQIAIGALNKNLLVDFWVNKLGCIKVSEYISEVSLLLSIAIFISVIIYLCIV